MPMSASYQPPSEITSTTAQAIGPAQPDAVRSVKLTVYSLTHPGHVGKQRGCRAATARFSRRARHRRETRIAVRACRARRAPEAIAGSADRERRAGDARSRAGSDSPARVARRRRLTRSRASPRRAALLTFRRSEEAHV